MVNSVTTEENVNSIPEINNCITANIIYIELGGVRFMVDLAILRLFPESILITMFPTGIPLVNIKQQYKSLTRLQQFFQKLIKMNIESIENLNFDISDFTDENEIFVNPNLSPMDEVFILYINFDPKLFEYLYKYFSIKFTKMQYLKFREQFEEGELTNIDLADIQQIKNLFYITISQQIILVLREEIEYFVIPAVTLDSAENNVEQTNSIVQLYNKDLCNLEFMHQLKMVCSQFLVDRKNVLVKLDNIEEFEDITKAHLYLEELNNKADDKASASGSLSSRFLSKSLEKRKRNYAILNTLNILTKIQSNSTWGYRAQETNKTKINSIVMLLVNLPINTINQGYEYAGEEEENISTSQQPQQIPQPQPQPTQPNNTTIDNSYNNRNNNTIESLNNGTTENTTSDKNEVKRESMVRIVDKIREEEERENKKDESEVIEDEEDVPSRISKSRLNANKRSFIVLNDMADSSINFESNDEPSRLLHHSKSSNNIETNYVEENSELFESQTDIYESGSNVFKSCNNIVANSRNSILLNESQNFLYHSCLDIDSSKVGTDSMDSVDNNIETKLDIDNIDNIENKLEEIHMKCSDENSIIIHNSIRDIVRSSSKDEENLKIISYIQDEVSDNPHSNDSINITHNNDSLNLTNTSVTTDIIGSSPLANPDNEMILPMIVPSNDKTSVNNNSILTSFDNQDTMNDTNDSVVQHCQQPSGATGASINNINSNTNTNTNMTNISNTDQTNTENNASDSSYSTTDDMTNEIVVPELSNMVTQVEPEPEYNNENMNNTLSILQPCRNFWWESVALHLELPKDKYQINEQLKLNYSDIKFSNISIDDIKEQSYNIDDAESSLDFIDLKLWLRRQWTVEFCAV